ncbi:hypothetical protein [Bacillus altitudinis]|uniref:hypothetical protein n=1 Tax=Bacillus altitudinis TaxID=293387 RepID=UPI003000603F
MMKFKNKYDALNHLNDKYDVLNHEVTSFEGIEEFWHCFKQLNLMNKIHGDDFKLATNICV